MSNIQFFFDMIFYFSLLSIFKLIFEFVSALFDSPPKRLRLSNNSLIFYGVTLSYILSYLI